MPCNILGVLHNIHTNKDLKYWYNQACRLKSAYVKRSLIMKYVFITWESLPPKILCSPL